AYQQEYGRQINPLNAAGDVVEVRSQQVLIAPG
ncbi:MAG: hypothetical protein ACI82Q_003042, partial [Nonlabens sp.]